MQIQDLLRTRVALPYTDIHSSGLLVRVPPDREHSVRVSYVAAGACDSRPRRMQALVERLVRRGYVVHSASDVNDPTLVMRWEHALRMPNYAFSVKPLDYLPAVERTVSVDEVLEMFARGSACPCCGSSEGLTVWEDEKAVIRWRCPSTTQTGGIVELVRLLDPELDNEEACLLLLERFDLLPPPLLAKMRAAGIDPQQETAAGDGTVAARRAGEILAGYGLSAETIAQFGLHVDEGTQRLAIPLRADGKLAGHILRALWSAATCAECGTKTTAKEISDLIRQTRAPNLCPACGKPGLPWLTCQRPMHLCRAEADFERRQFVYNLDQAVAELDQPEAEALYVLDDYSDCWVAVEGGYRAAVSTNGAMRPEKAVRIAAAAAGKPVVLVPDFDKAGIAGAENAIQMLLGADPNLDVRVADQCLNFWGVEASGATDLGQAATRIGVARAVAPLKFTSHWAVFLTRQIVDVDNPTWDTAQLNQQKAKIGRLLGQISAEHVKPVHEAIRQILELAWEPLMPLASVDAWFAFTVASSAPDFEQKALADSGVADWIEQHGSEVLKHGMRRGYDIAELYARERATAEFGPGVQVLPAGTGAAKGLKKRNHPSEAELARELAVINTGSVDERQVRIVYVEQWSQGGVAIHDWAGQFTVLVPVHDN